MTSSPVTTSRSATRSPWTTVGLKSQREVSSRTASHRSRRTGETCEVEAPRSSSSRRRRRTSPASRTGTPARSTTAVVTSCSAARLRPTERHTPGEAARCTRSTGRPRGAGNTMARPPSGSGASALGRGTSNGSTPASSRTASVSASTRDPAAAVRGAVTTHTPPSASWTRAASTSARPAWAGATATGTVPGIAATSSAASAAGLRGRRAAAVGPDDRLVPVPLPRGGTSVAGTSGPSSGSGAGTHEAGAGPSPRRAGADASVGAAACGSSSSPATRQP